MNVALYNVNAAVNGPLMLWGPSQLVNVRRLSLVPIRDIRYGAYEDAAALFSV